MNDIEYYEEEILNLKLNVCPICYRITTSSGVIE